ncbi:MAG: thioredoxin domain-containing protein [Thermoflavifilum aggregans]|nr:thioredoxin domain-containing protein [Thermoflavifilum aggregans]
MTSAHTNALIHATSPYLLLHAHNPVNWYPWCDEALQKAQQENKLLIISIGYAACHWCHVMEKEVFSDEEAAAFMNAHFVSIKVDREERPDLDQLYMQACVLINGHGGWPLNAFALPDGRPFYAVTYLPKRQWLHVLQQIVNLYEQQPEQWIQQAQQLSEGIRQSLVIPLQPEQKHRKPLRDVYISLFENIQSSIDFTRGGFNRAPKFPMPAVWEWLLQYYYFTHREEALQAVNTTLHHMALGGIYDQIGGGFCRYATDSQWRIPHFEKMLYDNAQLISLYAHAWQLTRQHLYAEIIRQSIAFVERELTNPQGACYASIDADSEGEEGKFYVWTEQEIRDLLDDTTASLILDYYHVNRHGNWEAGKNVLYVTEDDASFATQHQLDLQEWQMLLQQAREKLFAYRTQRTRPATDTKILTSWNALMIKAYIDAYRAWGEKAYLDKAFDIIRFIEKYMQDPDQGLWRNFAQGKHGVPAMLDDYAFLAEAYLECYQVTFDIRWLQRARALVQFARDHFLDASSKCFFYTADTFTPASGFRIMETEDQVIPSSNAAMAHVLYRLGIYMDEPAFTDHAMQMLHAMLSQIQATPAYMAKWAQLLGLASYGLYEIAVLGDEAQAMAAEMQQHFLPDCLFMGGADENLPLLQHKLIPGKTRIYVCKNQVCQAPVTSVDEALAQITSA